MFKRYSGDILKMSNRLKISSEHLDMHAMWDIENNHDKSIETVKNKICVNK